MEVTITQFRSQLFDLANRALAGETIKVNYKGRCIVLSPEVAPATGLDRVTKLDFITPGESALIEDADMKAEMQAEWEADWAEM